MGGIRGQLFGKSQYEVDQAIAISVDTLILSFSNFSKIRNELSTDFKSLKPDNQISGLKPIPSRNRL
jgi:hypothetical protein